MIHPIMPLICTFTIESFKDFWVLRPVRPRKQIHTKCPLSAWSPSPSKTSSLRASSRSTRAPSPADHLARAAVEIMQRIRDGGVDHDNWLQDLKVASGREEDPLKLLHVIAGYESCCRCTTDFQTGAFKAKKETELAVSEEIRARIKSFLESQWTTFEKLCSSAEIAKACMAVAQLGAKHRLAIREFAEGITQTQKAEDPEFVLRAMGALALFDNFKWIIIREGHKLNLVTADALDGGKPDAPVDPEEQEISKQMEALKVRLEHKRRAKIVRPLTPTALDEFVEGPGNTKWMREAAASLKKFLESNEGDKGETLAKELWEVMLVSKDGYKEKYPSGGHSVTGASHKGTGKQPQSRVSARFVKELERLGARTWIEATRKGRFRFAEWENITYYRTARGDNAYDVAKGPPGPCGECGDNHWIWDCEN